MAAPRLFTVRRAAAISLGLLVALVALSLFVYSPWHRHSRVPGQTCAFSSFEHAAGLQAACEDPLPPPIILARYDPGTQTVTLPAPRRTAHRGRAPPA
jgi:hypothetical protein